MYTECVFMYYAAPGLGRVISHFSRIKKNLTFCKKRCTHRANMCNMPAPAWRERFLVSGDRKKLKKVLASMVLNLLIFRVFAELNFPSENKAKQ